VPGTSWSRSSPLSHIELWTAQVRAASDLVMARVCAAAGLLARGGRAKMSSDAAAVARLQQRLPGLHEASMSQLAPVWDSMTLAAAALTDSPAIILDLASGPAAEPACTLALRFPRSEVVASDSDAAACARAAQRVQELGLGGRVAVHQIDLMDLASLDANAEGLQCDLATCALGLFMLPRTDQVPCLRGLHALLRPGGSLVAAVWERMPLIAIGSRCLAKAIGEHALPPELPFEPESLGGGQADSILASAGFELVPHNQVERLRLRLGPIGAEETWMVGLMPFAGALVALAESGQVAPGVFERAIAAFEAEMRGHGDATDAVVELEFRLLVARKPVL